MSLFPRLAIALLIIGVTTPPAQAIQRDITQLDLPSAKQSLAQFGYGARYASAHDGSPCALAGLRMGFFPTEWLYMGATEDIGTYLGDDSKPFVSVGLATGLTGAPLHGM